MAKIKKGKVLGQGKTKMIHEAVGLPGKGVIKSLDNITKNDDPAATQKMVNKGEYSTITTSANFRLLKQAGLPVAFDEQLSDREFLAPLCKMIPLEVVVRRCIVPGSSYLKRCPQFASEVAKKPHRFHRLVFELFLKTTNGEMVAFDGRKLGKTPLMDNGRHLDDPYIQDPDQDMWDLYQPKMPEWDPKSNLKTYVFKTDILPPDVTVEEIEALARKAFLLIEGAWAQLGFREVDFKLEFGVDSKGRLLIADVIDNDSWRVLNKLGIDISKQGFRDCVDMKDVTNNYAMVANLVQRFAIPDQALVLWCGSEKDEKHLPKELPNVAGVKVVRIFKSGHKEPVSMTDKLEEVLAEYPQGGVIVAPVGMSDGLAPTLAARTSWPVIAVAISADTRPHDVWSSLEVPSQVPPSTMLNLNNAILHALNILGQKNPAAYMYRQLALEELDK